MELCGVESSIGVLMADDVESVVELPAGGDRVSDRRRADRRGPAIVGMRLWRASVVAEGRGRKVEQGDMVYDREGRGGEKGQEISTTPM